MFVFVFVFVFGEDGPPQRLGLPGALVRLRSPAGEKILDRLLQLSELLGYPLRLSALEPRSEPHSRDGIRRALIAISDARLALMVLMQQDLGLRSKNDSDIGARDGHRMLRS